MTTLQTFPIGTPLIAAVLKYHAFIATSRYCEKSEISSRPFRLKFVGYPKVKILILDSSAS